MKFKIQNKISETIEMNYNHLNLKSREFEKMSCQRIG